MSIFEETFRTIKPKLDNLNKTQAAILLSFSILLALLSITIIFYTINLSRIYLLAIDCFGILLTLATLIIPCCMLSLLYGNKYWDDKYIFLVFLTFSFIDLFIQIVNLNFNSDFLNFDLNFLFVHVLFIMVIVNHYSHSLLSIFGSISFLLVLYLSRFFFLHSYGNLMPKILCAYVAYICVFCGIVLAKYIECSNNFWQRNRQLIRQPLTNGDARKALDFQKDNQETQSSTRVDDMHQYAIKSSLVKQRRRNSTNSSHMIQKRRTSLPIIPVNINKCMFADAIMVQEILGLLEDMLNDLTIKNNTYSGLKTIQHLLNELLYFKSTLNRAPSSRQIKTVNSSLNKLNNICGFDKTSFESDDVDATPFMEKDENGKSRRTAPKLTRRMSTIVWSTTTSASGMRILDSQPFRPRSASLKGSLFITNQIPLPNTILTESDEICDAKQRFFNDDDFDAPVKMSDDTRNQITSGYESGESSANSDYSTDTDKIYATSSEFQVFTKDYAKKLEGIKEEPPSPSLQTKAKLKSLPWDPNELDNLELLNCINVWNFPIFTFFEKSNSFVLSKLAYKIFQEAGLFQLFDIPIDAFIHYFHALESGYRDLPYHNRIHAADVLHACYYLTTQSVPYFVPIELENAVNLNERPKLKKYQHQTKFNNEIYGCLGANFLPIEILALYCSAAMHDYDHPGLNNQFLVTTSSPLAVLYNDRSVLENHHAAASWSLLKSDDKFNFLVNLEASEWKRFRYMVIENILATDLSKHFLILADFSSKANTDNNSNGFGIDWQCEADRLMVNQMVIKLADICAPLKEKDLHIQWTDRIMMEFYAQGDAESRANFPISAYMDRRNPQVAKLQETFIKNLVGSTCNAYSQAGLLPGILIDSMDSDLEHDTSDDDDDLSTDSERDHGDERRRKKKIYSEITSNLKQNYDMWCEHVKQEQTKVV